MKRFCSYHYDIENIVLVDPSNAAFITRFNPFLARHGVEIDVQLSGIVRSVLRAWEAENTNEQPTLDRLLRLVGAAMIVRGIPLHDVIYLIDFEQKKIREEVIASFSEPVVKAAWRQLQELPRADWRAEVLSTRNRLFRLAQSPTIRRFMGNVDPDANLDLLKIMAERKTLLVNLKPSRQLMIENAKTIAALFLNELFTLAMMFRDSDTLGYEPDPYYVYLDEWQNVVSADIHAILGQARKFGLLLVLANQDFAQIEKAFSANFVDTLMTCCQAKVCFGGLNRNDALRMARELSHGVDLAETKYEVTSTKFRPVYRRDRVYTNSNMISRSEGSSISETEANAAGVSIGSTSAPYVWLEALRGTTSRSNTETSSSATTISHSVGTTVAEGVSVADIPIVVPDEFTEVSSRTTYTLEEQLWRFSDLLKKQPKRHCYVSLPEQETTSIWVPFVEEYFVAPEIVLEYEKDIAAGTGAKTPHEVDSILSQQPSIISPARAQLLDFATGAEDDMCFRE